VGGNAKEFMNRRTQFLQRKLTHTLALILDLEGDLIEHKYASRKKEAEFASGLIEQTKTIQDSLLKVKNLRCL
jgi:hypothetical protein